MMKQTTSGGPAYGEVGKAFRMACGSCGATIDIKVVTGPSRVDEQDRMADPYWDFYCPLCSSAEDSVVATTTATR